MREVVTKVYEYGELSDKAKERARDWYREVDVFADTVETEDFETICSILGITLKTREIKLMNGKTRREPCIWYNVGGYQGDGACFEGHYAYAKLAHVKIREHAPEDKELHRIADALYQTQRAHSYGLIAEIVSGREATSQDAKIDVENGRNQDDFDAETGADVSEALRDLMDWYYKYLQAEYEYRMSDEAVAETIEANEYEFDEDGNRA
jgi:hypothetical protein